MGDVAAVAIFSDQSVRVGCGEGTIACAAFDEDKTPVLILPNPCPLAEVDLYAAIVCHEIGHLNGWPKGHGK
jgi:hypothetical protein